MEKNFFNQAVADYDKIYASEVVGNELKNNPSFRNVFINTYCQLLLQRPDVKISYYSEGINFEFPSRSYDDNYTGTGLWSQIQDYSTISINIKKEKNASYLCREDIASVLYSVNTNLPLDKRVELEKQRWKLSKNLVVYDD